MAEAASDRTGTVRAAPGDRDAMLDALWETYEAHREIEERNRLVVAYAPIVKFVAGRLGATLGTIAELEDLIGYGMIGLVDAIEKFEPDRGLRFTTYASHRIRGAIIDEVRRLDWAPRRVRRKIRQMDAASEELAQELQRRPDDHEVAARVGEDVGQSRADAVCASVLSIDAPIGDSDADVIDLRLGCADAGMTDVENQMFVRSLLASLPTRDRLIVERYYFEGCSLAEIGTELGVTESRVSQLLSRIKRRLAESHSWMRAAS